MTSGVKQLASFTSLDHRQLNFSGQQLSGIGLRAMYQMTPIIVYRHHTHSMIQSQAFSTLGLMQNVSQFYLRDQITRLLKTPIKQLEQDCSGSLKATVVDRNKNSFTLITAMKPKRPQIRYLLTVFVIFLQSSEIFGLRRVPKYYDSCCCWGCCYPL